MKIVITERQYRLIERIIENEVFCDKCNWNWDWTVEEGKPDQYICHKCGHDNTPTIKESKEIDSEITTPTRYTYVSMKPYENKLRKLSRIYFNDILAVTDNDPIQGKVKFDGPVGNFVFDKDVIRIDNVKKNANIDSSIFNEKYSTSEKVNLPKSIGITSTNIRKALEMAFPNNWDEETNDITAGLRGIYTIGSKLNNVEDWSIMNYFDTKDEIHNLLYLKYIEDKSNEPIIDWLVDLFQNDKDFTQLLVNRQWTSISNGLNLERDSVTNFLNKIKSNNVSYYPHGSKMDRWYGVDVSIDNVNYQIKPLKTYSIEDEQYVVNTYGMMDYKNKSKVNKIVFSNDKETLIFDNSNYNVISKYKVVFYQKPQIVN